MTKKKIGLIGAGYVGSSLATQLVKLGYSVKVANSRGVETLIDFEKQTGAKAVSLENVIVDIDILFIAIPFGHIPKLQKLISSLSKNVIVVDTGNYYPRRDGSIKEIEQGMPDTVWASQQLQHPLVKVFNNIIAYENGFITYSKVKDVSGRIALPVSSDDPKTQAVVMELVEEFGFTAYNAGSLAESWRQQGGQPAYCTNPTLEELPLLLKKAVSQEKSRKNQDTAAKIMEKIPKDYPIDNLIRASRLMVGLDTLKPKSWWALIKLGIATLR